MEAEENGNQPEKKTRHRSPNYPAIGLREAVERVRKFYAADGKTGATAEVAVKHMGYASPHGQALAALAAMKRFGLVAEVNGRMAPTQRALEIINLPESDQRRIAALREAVISPSIYRSLIEESPDGLPSDDAMQSELVTYKGFNPNAVKGFVKDFRDSLDFAGLLDIALLGLDLEEQSEPDMTMSEEVQNLGASHVRTRPITAATPITTQLTAATRQATAEDISTPVGKDGDAIVFANVRFSAGMKKEYIASLKKYLEYLETTLQ